VDGASLDSRLMARHVVLLRGINIGPRNRVAMPKLREVLVDAGFDDVETYLQSGNVVVGSALSPQKVATACRRAIAEDFGLDLEVLVRSRPQLATIVKLDPLGRVANDPKRYQVTFLAAKPKRELVEELEGLTAGRERIAAHGRELYAWHPDGVARSKLWARLGSKDLGLAATSRNWTTVTKLLELAGE
jgi:uncharacterized protein (DUF1697 family)